MCVLSQGRLGYLINKSDSHTATNMQVQISVPADGQVNVDVLRASLDTLLGAVCGALPKWGGNGA